MAKTKKIIRNIRCTLDGLLPDLQDNRDRGAWTKAVKTALCSMAKEKYGWHVTADVQDDDGNLQFDGREWLYDVTCRKYDGDDYQRRVPMVAECEWGPANSIYYDFEKLLLARADVRVMIFTGSGDVISDVFTELAAYICKSEHTLPGDTYLLVACKRSGGNDGNWVFRYRLIKAYKKIRDLQ